MEIFSALLAVCAGNSLVPGEFPAQKPVTQSFDVSLICARINDWVNNRKAGDLRRHRAHNDVIVMMWNNLMISPPFPFQVQTKWFKRSYHYIYVKVQFHIWQVSAQLIPSSGDTIRIGMWLKGSKYIWLRWSEVLTYICSLQNCRLSRWNRRLS